MWKGFSADDVEARRLQHRGRCGALQREGGDLLGLLGDLDVEAEALSSSQGRWRSWQQRREVLRPSRNSVPSSSTLPVVVAPGGVVHAADRQLAGIADRQAVEVGGGVRPRDAVLHHRRQVIDRGCLRMAVYSIASSSIARARSCSRAQGPQSFSTLSGRGARMERASCAAAS